MPFIDGASLLVTRGGGGIIYYGEITGVYICIYATIRAIIKLHEQEGNSTSTRHSNTSVNPSKEMVANGYFWYRGTGVEALRTSD